MKRIGENWKSEMISNQRSAFSIQPQAYSLEQYLLKTSAPLRFRSIALLFAVAVFLLAALPSFASAVGLDTTFNGTGYRTYDGGSNEYILGIAIDSSGRIVAAGTNNNDMMVWRFNTNGTLDTTFNGTGIFTHNSAAGGNGYDDGVEIAIDSSGRILVTGCSANASGNYDMTIWRLNTNGTLDTTFNGQGYFTHDLNYHDRGSAIAIDSSDRIIVAGWSGWSFMVVWRINENGTLDTTFNSTGYYASPLMSGALAMALDSSGRIVVGGGISDTDPNGDMAVWRLNTDGTLDTTFNGTGYFKHAGAAGGSAQDLVNYNGVKLDSAGRILLSGHSFNASGNQDMAVWRLNGDGSLDTSFNGVGYFTYNGTANSHDGGYGITIDSSGRILVTGRSDNVSNEDMAVWRFNSNGTLDTTFNGTGIYTHDNAAGGNSHDIGFDLAIDSMGRIIVGGYSDNASGNQDMALWRLDAGDPAFTVTTLASGLSGPFDMAVDATSVYWTELNGGTVKKVGLNGGTVTTLASGLSDPWGIAVDATSVYWTENVGGTVKKVGINGGTVTTLASGLNSPVGIAIDGTSVYWTENLGGTVKKVGLNGGTVITLASGSGPIGIAVDAENVYFAETGGSDIKKVGINGGPVTTLATGLSHPYAVAVNATSVYFTDGNGSSTGTVKKVGINGGTITTLDSGVNNPHFITLDTASAYWTEIGSNTVQKVGLNGGTDTPLASGLNNPVGIAVDATSVYWTEYAGGTVKKMWKGTFFKLPDTGQTTSYTSTFGEDHDYTINPPSYTDNGNGTITDNNTGLIWQKEDDNTLRNWADAGTYCDGLSLGGQTDWRLPNVMELMSIVNYGTYDPAIDTTYFPNTNSSHWWSSTTYAYDTTYAWVVHFAYGGVGNYGKANTDYVRCVRGNEVVIGDFVDNSDGTVTDNSTGLMWQQGEGGSKSWESALTYCDGLSLAGQTDWRLPDIKELRSIVDDARYSPNIDTTYFPNTNSTYYWSSTTVAADTSAAWHVDFLWGFASYNGKTDTDGVRCVRGSSGIAVPLYTITSSAGANGSITPSGSVPVISGGSQPFTIAPNTGYHVSDVLVDGSSVGAVTTYTFTNVTAGHSISATFALSADTTPDPFAFTAQTGVALNSVITSNTITVSGINTASPISITGGEYSVSTNSGATWSAFSTSTPSTVNLNDQVKVRQTSSSSYSTPTTVTLTIGGVSGTFSVTTIAAPVVITYTVTPSAGANGSISPSTPQVVSPNATPSFTITPDPGYHTAIVDGTCAGTLSANTYTTTPVTADCTISVTFAINTSDNTVPPGNNVTVTPIPGVDLTFSNVTTGGTATVTQNSNPSPPANFRIPGGITYEITFTGTFTGPVTVCFTYDPAEVHGNESNLKLMHREITGWVDITSPGYPDTTNHRICGVTTSFSEFAIVEPGVAPGTPLPPWDPAHMGPVDSSTLRNPASGACVTGTSCYGGVGEGFTFTAGASGTTGGGVAPAVYVDWDDGSAVEGPMANGNSTTHAYTNPGTYHVHVYVKDAWGYTAETIYTAVAQKGSGKGTLKIQASGTATACGTAAGCFGNRLDNAGNPIANQPLGLSYQVIDATVIPNVIVTSGTLVPSSDPLNNFKAIVLDAGTYTVKLMFPPTLIGASTYHNCTGFNTSTTSSYTSAGNAVTAGGTTTLSGITCQ